MTQLALLLARRYLFSRQLSGKVNLISAIALAGISLGVMALVLALSVFNGFEALLADRFAQFDPDLKLLPQQGVEIQLEPELLDSLQQHPKVAAVTYSLQGKAVLKYPGSDQEHLVEVKGVPDNFLQVVNADTLVYVGEWDLSTLQGRPGAVLGAGVAYLTQALLKAPDPMLLYTITEPNRLMQNPKSALRKQAIYPTGFFGIQKEYDDKYVLVNIRAARELFQEPTAVSTIELRLHPQADPDQTEAALERQFGQRFQILNPLEQHATLYKVMRSEKLVAFVVITFMLVLASFNIVGGLAMIVLEKQTDLAILQTLGFRPYDVWKTIFLLGLLLAGGGALAGLAAGSLLAWLQERFSLIGLRGADAFIIDHYPTALQVSDLLFILLTVCTIAVLATLYPAFRAARITVRQGLKQT